MSDEQVAKQTDRRDFVFHILKAQEKDPDQISNQDIVGYILAFLFAGSDTVSTTLRAIVYYMSECFD